MAVLDATVGGANANSFISVIRADTLLDETIHSSVWTATVKDDRERALIMATRTLSEDVTWVGARASATQALSHPRFGMFNQDGYEFDSNVIALWLEVATAEFARSLLVKDRTADTPQTGIQSISAGPVAVTFHAFEKPSVFPDFVKTLIRPYGKIAGSGIMATVIRT
jgi:hypothetical protein